MFFVSLMTNFYSQRHQCCVSQTWNANLTYHAYSSSGLTLKSALRNSFVRLYTSQFTRNKIRLVASSSPLSVIRRRFVLALVLAVIQHAFGTI